MVRLEIWLNVFLNHVQSLGFNSQQGGLEGEHIKLKHKIIKKTLIVQKKKKGEKKIKESSSKQIPSHRGSHFEFL